MTDMCRAASWHWIPNFYARRNKDFKVKLAKSTNL